MAEYVYDQDWKDERERLAGMERLWDPGTRDLLARLGVGEGWRCLEVGAGGGSVSQWLAERVGTGGHVVAADVSLRFLTPIEGGNLEARELDILGDDLPEGEFDLVYSRLVAEHLGTEAVRAMARCVKPGGLLVLEDYDWSVDLRDDFFQRVQDAVLGFMEQAGFDPYFGRRLIAEMASAGIEAVAADGRVRVVRGGTPETAFFRLSLVSLEDALLEAGAIAAGEAEAALARFDDPAEVMLSPVMVAAWGRRPDR
ncbi:MAG TPA: methyltransferase domain-containing protein [Solirubrobacterales bacterium]